MKEIIDRHVYDTTTSRRIMEYYERYDNTDEIVEVAYYRTRSGLYFEYINGDFNERITPIAERQAVRLAKNRPQIVIDKKWQLKLNSPASERQINAVV